MRAPLESSVEGDVCGYAESKGWWALKFVSPGEPGVPDHIFLKNGRVIFIEFKRRGKPPTSQQLRKHDRLRDAGFEVHVIDTYEEGCAIFD